MKTLIVSGFFYPANTPRAFRTTELAKELSRLGHSVTLYVPKCDHDYISMIKEYPTMDLRFFDKVDKEIPQNRMKYLLWRILDLYFAYSNIKYFKMLKKILKNETEYDLLISIAVPHGIHWGIGRIYKSREIAKTWVADCGDPYMLCKTDSRSKPFYFEWFEKLWCKKCDYITVPTDTSYTGYYPEFHSKIRIIPQGFNFDAIHFPEYKKNEVPTFAFAGGFIKGVRDPQRLMEFLTTIDKPFKFVVYGSTSNQFLDQFKDKLGNKLVIENPIPRSQLLPKLAQVDFLINIGNGTKVQTPSKIIDYTLTKRPILTIESNDIKENVLFEFLNGDYTHKDQVIEINRYDIHNVAQQFIDLAK